MYICLHVSWDCFGSVLFVLMCVLLCARGVFVRVCLICVRTFMCARACEEDRCVYVSACSVCVFWERIVCAYIRVTVCAWCVCVCVCLCAFVCVRARV